MPTRERSFGRSVFGSEIEMPLTTMSPFWNGSRALTVLISVDLPDPDGPQTTTTSPLLIAVVQSVSTWKVPYHLETSLMSIMKVSRRWRLSADDGDLPLQPPNGHRQAEADDEVDDGGDEIGLDRPVEVLAGDLEALQQVVGADRIDERRVLEEDDRLREQHRQHVAERLRQHDQLHALRVRHADRVAGGDLPLRDRLDAGAHDLRVVRCLEDGEGDDRRGLGAERPAEEERDQQEEPEDHH